MKLTFSKVVVCHTNDFPANKNDKIETWIKNRGGKVVKELTDDVTHYVVSGRVWRANWQDDHPVRTARRKGTIYVVKFDWLEDSLMSTHGRPLEESNEKYAWEVPHAKRVKEKRRKQKQENNKLKKRENKAASIASAYGSELDIDCSDDMSDQDLMNGNGTPNKPGQTTNPNRVTKSKSTTVTEKKKAQKMKDIIQCGIKFDKSCLEFEKDMALAGYRPYTDSNNFTYLIMLVRDDVFTGIEERYQLKPSTQNSASLPARGNQCSYSSHASNSSNNIPTSLVPPQSRFQVNKSTTVLHYLEDRYCCQNFKRPFWDTDIDTINDGHCTPKLDPSKRKTRSIRLPFNNTCFDCRFITPSTDPVFSHWPQHLPFSIHPAIPYNPDVVTSCLPEPRPHRHVKLPKPLAYSVQLYETYTATAQPRPKIPASISLSSVRSSSTFSSAAQLGVPFTSIPSLYSHAQQLVAPAKKTYAVVAQYTRKGRSQAEPVFLAPKGSSWDFAIDAFRKMFAKKTGMTWEDALSGGRQDNGTSVLVPSEHKGAKDNMDVGNDKFKYMPNTSESLEKVRKQYKQYLGEDWLVPEPQSPDCATTKPGSTEATATTTEDAVRNSDAVEATDQGESDRAESYAADNRANDRKHGDKDFCAEEVPDAQTVSLPDRGEDKTE